LLVRRGASIDVSNDKQETPLYRAVTNGNATITRLLIDHGATVQTADSNGWSLLQAASRHGHIGLVKLLLLRGADVDLLNKAGRSPSELASENGQIEVAKLISEYKADEHTRNKLRSITLDTVECNTDRDGGDEAKVLLKAAAEEGDIDTVKMLFEQGIDINNARNARDETVAQRRSQGERRCRALAHRVGSGGEST
jgi:ankyrin repeat protein